MPASKQTHCRKGHPLEGRNAIVKDFGWRECRECKNERDAASYHRRKHQGNAGA